jgi:hypothetical protein
MMIQVDGRTHVPLGRVAETMFDDTAQEDGADEHHDAEPAAGARCIVRLAFRA